MTICNDLGREGGHGHARYHGCDRGLVVVIINIPLYKNASYHQKWDDGEVNPRMEKVNKLNIQIIQSIHAINA